MTTRQFKLTLISSVALLCTMAAAAKFGEYQVDQQIIAQCNSRAWDKNYDHENRSFCLRFLTERGISYKYW